MTAAIVWFRRDLRLADNPALQAACAGNRPIVPVYVHAPEELGAWAPGAASDWWLHQSLAALAGELRELGLDLVLRRGPSLQALTRLIRETGADAVHWNRLYEPAIIARDREIKAELRRAGLEVHSHNAALLHEPWTVQTGTGGDYRAFTPFWKACRRREEPPAPAPAPTQLAAPAGGLPEGEPLDAMGLLPAIRWDRKLEGHWQPGSAGAEARLAAFLDDGLASYDEGRDLPAQPATSRLSPHLHFGEIGPRQVWHAVQRRLARDGAGSLTAGAEAFLAEVGWREFAYHVLFHHPGFPDEPLNPRFSRFPWREDDGRLRHAWERGETGLPMVDAGMRELWATGWMHNRVRMVTGSLLVKNLRLPWQQGERWFWDTLVDADLASNSLGWQWVAGSGADAAPYFRVFNPVRQGERFDPDGEYVARWIPELAGLPAQHRHAPWQAPASALRAAGLRLDEHYPRPVVDLKRSREEALEAFQLIKQASA
ncbi:cryptochrome/photolyase family protein [Spiribacter halobius]|uniref:Deoxyribodipyrimidine photo-lyase n=1 Tax=Sediminicurvatus halobius TaxID=2182432 RepID=A0A2U2MWN9_9GAMM|nr:deoxyribodipyrimidine photo-lyase [Spiribacter halobius]PWG61278.1 deoxyribodipyrimidine photolyase [Spiribacter halobius]UEX78412.1 DNA photolyase family protein [Spiribacter halobius]